MKNNQPLRQFLIYIPLSLSLLQTYPLHPSLEVKNTFYSQTADFIDDYLDKSLTSETKELSENLLENNQFTTFLHENTIDNLQHLQNIHKKITSKIVSKKTKDVETLTNTLSLQLNESSQILQKQIDMWSKQQQQFENEHHQAFINSTQNTFLLQSLYQTAQIARIDSQKKEIKKILDLTKESRNLNLAYANRRLQLQETEDYEMLEYMTSSKNLEIKQLQRKKEKEDTFYIQ